MYNIEFSKVTRDNLPYTAINNFSLSIEEGEAYALLAPKNSGKRTLLSLLMGIIKPDSGSVKVSGYDCFSNRHKVHQNVGFVLGHVGFPENMDGEAFIRLMSSWRGGLSKSKLQFVLEKLDINPLGQFKYMDSENLKKMSILCGLMYDSPILVLEEPYAGLSPIAQDSLSELLLEEKTQGKTIFLMTRILQHAQRVGDRIGVMRKGSLVTEQKVDDFKAVRQKVYHIVFSSPTEASRFSQEWEDAVELMGKRAIVVIPSSPKTLIKTLGNYDIVDFVGGREEGEDAILRYYGDEMQ